MVENGLKSAIIQSSYIGVRKQAARDYRDMLTANPSSRKFYEEGLIKQLVFLKTSPCREKTRVIFTKIGIRKKDHRLWNNLLRRGLLES